MGHVIVGFFFLGMENVEFLFSLTGVSPSKFFEVRNLARYPRIVSAKFHQNPTIGLGNLKIGTNMQLDQGSNMINVRTPGGGGEGIPEAVNPPWIFTC